MPNRVWVLDVPDEDRAELRRRAADRSSKDGTRARIVLLSADGLPAARIAERLGCSEPTVGLWRRRYASGGLEGLRDTPPRPTRRVTDVPEIVTRSLDPPPERLGEPYWTSRTLAAELGVSNSTVARVWREWGLRPRALESFTFPTAPRLHPGVDDVVGLYLGPPHRAVVVRSGRSWVGPGRGRTYPRPVLTSLLHALRAPARQTVAGTSLGRFLDLAARAAPPVDLAVVHDLASPPRSDRFTAHRVTGVDWLDLVEVFLLRVARAVLGMTSLERSRQAVRTTGGLIAGRYARGTPFTWVRPNTCQQTTRQ